MIEIRRRIRISSQISEVLHQYESAVEFGADQILIVRYCPKDLRSSLSAPGQIAYQLIAFCGRERVTRASVQHIDELRRRH